MKKQAVDLICQAYKEMHAAIQQPENDYKDAAGIVPRTPEQVTQLLS